jgi:IrrE N-terminal-like domain
VEEREMIPEAAMQPRDGRFYIYVQSNFKDQAGSAYRRRFSLAHEIGHTLFFEQRGGELKARADAPRGDALEAACHRAASMILVPAKTLRAELQRQPVESTAQIDRLAARFAVSVEVMLRRLHDSDAFVHGWAPVLTRRTGPGLVIEYGAYPVWLKPYSDAPKRGVEFSTWFRATEQEEGVLKKRVGEVMIEASPVNVTSSLVIFELRMHS